MPESEAAETTGITIIWSVSYQELVDYILAGFQQITKKFGWFLLQSKHVFSANLHVI